MASHCVEAAEESDLVSVPGPHGSPHWHGCEVTLVCGFDLHFLMLDFLSTASCAHIFSGEMTVYIICPWKFSFEYFVCVGILPACIHVCHMCAWVCPRSEVGV